MTPINPSIYSKRTIIIGDIHGCFHELSELVNLLDLRPDDELICLGDLICKGPDSLKVMEWAINTKNVKFVLGNHEARFLRAWKEGKIPDSKIYDLFTYNQLSTKFDYYMDFINSWPLFIKSNGVLVVHAGVDPRKSLSEQTLIDLTEIRKIKNTDIAWYDEYKGDDLVVFGHWVRKEPLIRKNAIGLDTGCVYGGSLSALILPEQKIVSVPAQKIYYKRDKPLC